MLHVPRTCRRRAASVRLVRVPGGEPACGGGCRAAPAAVRALPVQRLARARAVVGGPAHRAPPELMPPRLPPPAPRVRAQAQLLLRVLAGAASDSVCRSRRGLLGAHQRPPLHHEPAGRRGGSVVVLLPGGAAAARRRRGGGELARRGVEQEVAAGRGVAARAVAVLEAVAELAERRDVAQPRGARAQRHARARVLVRLAAAAAVEPHDGQRVQRGRVPAPRRASQQRRPRRPAPEAVEPHLGMHGRRQETEDGRWPEIEKQRKESRGRRRARVTIQIQFNWTFKN